MMFFTLQAKQIRIGRRFSDSNIPKDDVSSIKTTVKTVPNHSTSAAQEEACLNLTLMLAKGPLLMVYFLHFSHRAQNTNTPVEEAPRMQDGCTGSVLQHSVLFEPIYAFQGCLF